VTPPAAIVLDMEGVLQVGYEPVPGAVEAIARLRRAGLPLAILTNTTGRTREAIALRLRSSGFDFAAADIVTAASATADHLRRRHPGARVFLLAESGAVAEFGGIEIVGEAATADVVCIGGPDESFTYDRLQEAFRAVLDGAAFVAMQRNRWWPTPAGPGLDAGAFVRGLEFATGRSARILGKPSAGVYRAALEVLGSRAAATMMVGDDPVADLRTAGRIGMATCLVRTGKGATFPDPYPGVDLDLPSLAALPDALGT
jgi:HAD superfamily hydrolase (TIGR01458 family)